MKNVLQREIKSARTFLITYIACLQRRAYNHKMFYLCWRVIWNNLLKFGFIIYK